MFSKEQLAAASKQQAQDIAVTAKFMTMNRVLSQQQEDTPRY